LPRPKPNIRRKSIFIIKGIVANMKLWLHVINGTSIWNYESWFESNSSFYLVKYLNGSFQCPPILRRLSLRSVT
jgi:hypothetical protein